MKLTYPYPRGVVEPHDYQDATEVEAVMDLECTMDLPPPSLSVGGHSHTETLPLAHTHTHTHTHARTRVNKSVYKHCHKFYNNSIITLLYRCSRDADHSHLFVLSAAGVVCAIIIMNILQVNSKEGFLTKLGYHRKNWKIRWFSLYRNELKYFNTREDKVRSRNRVCRRVAPESLQLLHAVLASV